MASQPRQTTPPPVDPLADLRDPEPETPDLPPVQGNEDQDQAGETVDIRPMVTRATQEAMVSEAVAAFHADPTTQGFLHGGGQCGCRYVARVALQATIPVMTEEDLEEKDLEPAP